MAQLTLQQAFDQAFRHHQAGRLQEAEQLYRYVLIHQPTHFDALRLLGMIAHRLGQNYSAVELFRRAIAVNPTIAEIHGDLGIALVARGQLDEAIAAFGRAIALKPGHAESHSNLGNALKEKGQLDEAIAAYGVAIVLNPHFAEAHSNLGNALKDKGQLDQAIVAFRQAIKLNPTFPEGFSNLGTALQDKGELDEAISAFRRAIALKPNYPQAHYNLGVSLKTKGQLDEAISAFRQAIAHNPNFPQALSNLGDALNEKGHLDEEAIAACRRAIALRPNLPEAHVNLGIALAATGQLKDAVAAVHQAIALKPSAKALANLGNALKDEGQLDEAIATYRQAIRLDPSLPEASYNLSLALLTRGDFQEGWEEYEWRWKLKVFEPLLRNFAQPRWDGQVLAGRTILLHAAEQGFGDNVQFIRYVPMVAERGGRIIVECHPYLRRLFQTMGEVCQFVVRGDPLPAFDFHSPLLSLPRVFGTTLATVPNVVPYLQADAREAETWQRRLGDRSSAVKVGLVWAGNPTNRNDRNRSMKLARMAPLGQVSGVHFFSLQKGPAGRETQSPPARMELIDWTEELKDFADTAALIANLDLVISVDTAVAHLAGAMGKPVWTLQPFAPDWRWMLGREDSPWYPSMRLCRQPSRGDWDSVIRRVVDALSDWIKGRA